MNTYIFGVNRDRSAVHHWKHKTDLQPDSDTAPNQIAVNRTVIRVNSTANDCTPPSSKHERILQVQRFPERSSEWRLLFLRELQDGVAVEQPTSLDNSTRYVNLHLTALTSDLSCAPWKSDLLRIYNSKGRTIHLPACK